MCVCKNTWRSPRYGLEGFLLIEAQTAVFKEFVEYVEYEDIHIDFVFDDRFGHIMNGLDVTGINLINMSVSPAPTILTRPTPGSRPLQTRRYNPDSLGLATDSAP